MCGEYIRHGGGREGERTPSESGRQPLRDGGSPAKSESNGDAVEQTVQELFDDRPTRVVESSAIEQPAIDQLVETLVDESTSVEHRIEIREAIRAVLGADVAEDRIEALERLLDAVVTAQRMLEQDYQDLSTRVNRLERLLEESDA